MLKLTTNWFNIAKDDGTGVSIMILTNEHGQIVKKHTEPITMEDL